VIDLSIDDGIATIIWNVADRPMNVLNDASIAAFETTVRKGDRRSSGEGRHHLVVAARIRGRCGSRHASRHQ